MAETMNWVDKLAMIMAARTNKLIDNLVSKPTTTASTLQAQGSGLIPNTTYTTAIGIDPAFLQSGSSTGTIYINNQPQPIPHAHLGIGTSITTSYTPMISMEPPIDAVLLKSTVFPHKLPTVSRSPSYDRTYYLKKNWGYNLQKKDIEMDIHHIELTISDHVQDPMQGGKAAGLQPEQLLIVNIDYLNNKEDKTTEEENALKHMNYALAYLEKDVINKSKV